MTQKTMKKDLIAAAVEKAGYTATPARAVIPAQETVLKKKPAE